MKRHHIEYLKTMVEQISIGDELIFTDKFYEIVKPLKHLQHSTPSCFVVYGKADNFLEKNAKVYPLKKLDSIIDEVSGKKYLRSLERQSKQEYTYTLNFLVHDPAPDVLSSIGSPGILDQCISYVAANRKPTYKVPVPSDYITYQEFQEIELNCMVEIGQSGFSTDLVEDGIYIFYIDVKFLDGVYLLREEETLSGATFEIVPPVLVEDV